MPKNKLPNLPISDLAARHQGVTPSIADSYTEAASVCLQQHHTPPAIFLVKQQDLDSSEYIVAWIEPNEITKGAWNNEIDRIEYGAYCLAMASCEAELELYAIRRAETQTGADYYVSTDPNPPDLEDAIRLEVSGTDSGDEKAIQTRLRNKVKQALSAPVYLPAIAGVAGFREKLIMLSRVELGSK